MTHHVIEAVRAKSSKVAQVRTTTLSLSLSSTHKMPHPLPSPRPLQFPAQRSACGPNYGELLAFLFVPQRVGWSRIIHHELKTPTRGLASHSQLPSLERICMIMARNYLLSGRWGHDCWAACLLVGTAWNIKYGDVESRTPGPSITIDAE